MEAKDYGPIRRLVEELMRADYYAVPRLIGKDSIKANPYLQFFERFQHADFLTFNYDSFVEACLFRLGRWFPYDGLGVELTVGVEFGIDRPPIIPSKSLVLHLHGSVLVFKSEFDLSDPDRAGIRWLERKPETEFLFDPGAVAHLFFPWTRAYRPATGVDPPERRVIAPVPDKSTEVRQAFMKRIQERAVECIAEAHEVISIGYSFNPIDHDSYGFLLEAIARKQDPSLYLVDPLAGEIATRLEDRRPGLRIRPVDTTFSAWHAADFRLS